MALASLELITALRSTAKKLSTGVAYQWGHMGSCNCGNLAQELTKRTKAEIHEFAMMGRGDWNEQIQEYCPTSGLPMDMLIADMLNNGLSTTDLQNLEKLSDKNILVRIPLERRNAMRHNRRDDVVLYLNQWAEILEEILLEDIQLPDFQKISQEKHILEEVLV